MTYCLFLIDYLNIPFVEAAALISFELFLQVNNVFTMVVFIKMLMEQTKLSKQVKNAQYQQMTASGRTHVM